MLSITYYKYDALTKSCYSDMFIGNTGSHVSNGQYVYQTGEYKSEAECKSANGSYVDTTKTNVCTTEYRSCADGAAMPRDGSCGWHPEMCKPQSSTSVPNITAGKVEPARVTGERLLRVYGTNLTETIYIGSCASYYSYKGSTEEKAFDIATAYGHCFKEGENFSVYMINPNGIRSQSFTVQNPAVPVTPNLLPIITSAKVEPTRGYGERLLRVYGTNLTDTVYIGACTSYYSVKGSSEEKAFDIASAYNNCFLEGQNFSVYMINSNGVRSQSFTVQSAATPVTSTEPTVEIIGAPSLGLSYDSVGKESLLVAKAQIRITVGSSPITVYSSSVPYIVQFNTSSGAANSNSMFFSTNNSNTSNTVLAPNTSTVFDVTNTAKTAELFAGTYMLKPSGFSYIDASGQYKTIQPTSFKGTVYSNSVTITGETSPYIKSTYVDPGSKEPNQYFIEGIRFSPTSNYVSINGITKMLPSIPGYSDDGRETSRGIRINSSDFGITASGQYVATVTTDRGLSNRGILVATYQPTQSAQPSASTVEFLGSPVLSLLYDNGDREAALVGTAKFKITAGSNGVSYNVYNGVPTLITLPGANSYKVENISSGSAVTYENGVKTLQAMQSAYYAIKVSVQARELFAGTYSITTNNLTDSTGASVVPSTSFKGPTSSNSITVVGETSPYISGTPTCDSTPQVNCTISGIRFDPTSNSVTVNNITKVLPSFSNGTAINVVAADFNITSVGDYTVVVSTNNGASNWVRVSINSVPSRSRLQPIRNGVSAMNKVLLREGAMIARTLTGATTASASEGCVDIGSNLHRGFETEAVVSLQNFLIAKGLLSEKSSGFFGDLTITAVKAYQKSLGLPETGMVYDFTRQAIKQETCK